MVYFSFHFIRSKLCPNISSSYLKAYRFDLDAKNCSMIGKQSHCGKNMVFYSFSGSEVYGHCDCNYSSQIPLLYHAETNRCYFMYQQVSCILLSVSPECSGKNYLNKMETHSRRLVGSNKKARINYCVG